MHISTQCTYMYIRTHTCTHTYTHVYTCTHTCTRVHIRTHTCARVHMFKYVDIHTHIQSHNRGLNGGSGAVVKVKGYVGQHGRLWQVSQPKPQTLNLMSANIAAFGTSDRGDGGCQSVKYKKELNVKQTNISKNHLRIIFSIFYFY